MSNQASDNPEIVTVEREIKATPEAIFDLLADPTRHREFDGSGTVRNVRGAPSRHARLGDRFGMSMKMGVPYAMESTIVEFEENRLIAWRTTGPTRIGALLVGGRIWRYELEPTQEGTLVRESWNISGESILTKPVVRKAALTTRRNMEATLVRIEEVLT